MNLLLAIDWNFDPDLFKIGNFPIKYYSLMYVVGFVLGLQIMKKIFIKDNVSLDKLDPLFIYSIVAMLIGARMGHYLFYEDDYTWSEVFLPFKLDPFEYTGFRGLASHGATIGIMIAMYFYSKRVVKKPLLWTFDRMVIPSALISMLVRLGNLFNSEIVGKATESDSGFRFIRNDIPEYKAMGMTNASTPNEAYDLILNNPAYKHVLAEVPNRYPTQIYEAVGYFITFLILWYLYAKTDKKEKTGYIFGVFMVIFWSIRFVVEFYKEWQGGLEEWVDLGVRWNTGQFLSIPLVLIGIYFMFRKTKKVV